MRFLARHRRVITAIVGIFLVAGFIYLAVKTRNIETIHTVDSVYAGQAMGTAIKKTIYSQEEATSDAANTAINSCIKNLENQISVRVVDSEVSKCNLNYSPGGIYELSDNLVDYLKQEMEICKETKGAFSPCIRPISNLWGIEDGDTKVPEDSLIQDALENTNVDNMEVTDNGLCFKTSGMAFDFGATGKGIACDLVAELLPETGVQGAVISIGGSILTYGDKGDNKSWHIGIQDPRDEDGKVLGVVDIDGSQVISTSGDYEKYFEEDGKRYHHIFDPSTGYPAESGLISVTIISDNGLQSDAMSTACFVMGLTDGMAYVNEKGVDAIFVTEDKEVYITNGIKKTFHLKADGYTLKKKLEDYEG